MPAFLSIKERNIGDTRLIWRISICAVLCLVIGCSEAKSKYPNLISEHTHDGPSKSLERQMDTNGDGQPDGWYLVSWFGCEHQITATCSDENNDGTMENVAVDISSSEYGGPDTLQLADRKAEGRFNYRMVWLRNNRNTSFDQRSGIVYEDFNMDGLFDSYCDAAKKERYVLFNRRWEIAKDEKIDFNLPTAVILLDEKEVALKFENNGWVKVEQAGR